MDKQEQIIDLDFAVSQLSGNRSLLNKLLMKFHEQYENLAQELTTFKQSTDFKAYKGVIHTVKGVSGNLGLNALHFAAKELEACVINETSLDVCEQSFINTLNSTFIKIELLTNEDNTTIEPQKVEKTSQSQLISMLENNEFITPDKLESLINDCDLAQADKDDVKVAIGDLDYAEALNTLNRIS